MLDGILGSVNFGRWDLGWIWGRKMEMVGVGGEGFGMG